MANHTEIPLLPNKRTDLNQEADKVVEAIESLSQGIRKLNREQFLKSTVPGRFVYQMMGSGRPPKFVYYTYSDKLSDLRLSALAALRTLAWMVLKNRPEIQDAADVVYKYGREVADMGLFDESGTRSSGTKISIKATKPIKKPPRP